MSSVNGLWLMMMWPVTKLIRMFLIVKCIFYDNGHVWVKARHIKDTKHIISMFNLYECEGCGQVMATEK